MRILNMLKREIPLILVDLVIIICVPFLALLVRLDGNINSAYFSTLYSAIGYLVLLELCVFYLYGLYRRLWRYATIQDMFVIISAVSVGMVFAVLLGSYFNLNLPRSIYIISWVFQIGAICLSRLIIRITSFMLDSNDGQKTSVDRVIIIGAGDAGAMVAREILQRKDKQKVIGYIDDDICKQGSKLLGVPVLGKTGHIKNIVAEYEVNSIIVAMPSVSGDVIREILRSCQECKCKVKVLPGLYELIEGKATLKQLRDVSLEDLLRRDPVKLNLRQIAAYVENKVVLVTGAGGSIGSELCRQISKINPKQILLLGRGENSIYEIHRELKATYSEINYVPVIADIRDAERLNCVFAKYNPTVVFHAAAHKHVPLMEAQPAEAVKNNIFGTKNVVDVADKFGVEIFVMISTDKAVNPTSVMGATKRVAELIVQQRNVHSKTKYAVVRFGNVLGSRGSVVPLFERQIAQGGPITITHPEMVRYFMTIPEATQLVLQAGAISEGGEVFLLDMGKPVKILDMAKDLVELHGLIPDQDIRFVFTGLRPGEKLYEELLTSEEGTVSTCHKKIYRAALNSVDNRKLCKVLCRLKNTTDTKAIICNIGELVPTYQNIIFQQYKQRKLENTPIFHGKVM